MSKKKPNQVWVTIKFVLKNAKPQTRLLVMVVIFMLFYIAADFVHPFVYRRIINLVSENTDNPETALSTLVWFVFVLGISYLAHRLFRDVAGFALSRAEVRTMKRVANETFSHVIRLSYSFHASNFAGSTARKINRGVGKIEDLMDVLFYDLTPIVISMIVATVILLSTHLAIGLPLLVGLVFYFLVSMAMVKKRMKYDYIRNELETRASGVMIDSITNNLNVKTFVGERFEGKKYGQANYKWSLSAIKSWDWETWTSIFQGGFIAILEVAMLSISLFLWSVGQFTVGDIVFVQANIGLLIFPMWTLGRFYRNFRRAEVDLADVIELQAMKPAVQDLPGVGDLKISKGEIEMKNVAFAYDDGNRDVLDNLSLHIKPGEKLAIVGPSGAGKSTFIKLLFRFIEPDRGTIKIDGQDISRVSLDSLRRGIGLVPQEPFLFHRSILDNIRYGLPQASQAEVIKAAQMAHAHEFIKDLPQGYDSLVGERGIKLSGGERQRVALARVFLENAPILVLDEATSSLDSVSENLIQEALDKLMVNRTTMVIAHRLSTIMKMDRIIVIDKGRIVETGTHQELINQDTLYKFLWESQAGKFLD